MSFEDRVFEAFTDRDNSHGVLSFRSSESVLNVRRSVLVWHSKLLREVLATSPAPEGDTVVIIAPDLDLGAMETVEEILEMQWSSRSQIHFGSQVAEIIDCLALNLDIVKVPQPAKSEIKIKQERSIVSYFTKQKKNNPIEVLKPAVESPKSLKMTPKSTRSIEKKVSKTKLTEIRKKTTKEKKLPYKEPPKPAVPNVTYKCVKCDFQHSVTPENSWRVDLSLKLHVMTHFKKEFSYYENIYFKNHECIFCGDQVKAFKNKHMLSKHDLLKDEIDEMVQCLKNSVVSEEVNVKKEAAEDCSSVDGLKIVSIQENYKSEDELNSSIQELLLLEHSFDDDSDSDDHGED